MATEINAKVDLLKVSKDIVEHLGEVLGDVRAYVIPAQGQSSLTETARTALQSMTYMVASLEAMPDEVFLMVPEPASKGNEAQTQRGHPDAKGHQSRQHV